MLPARPYERILVDSAPGGPFEGGPFPECVSGVVLVPFAGDLVADIVCVDFPDLPDLFESAKAERVDQDPLRMPPAYATCDFHAAYQPTAAKHAGTPYEIPSSVKTYDGGDRRVLAIVTGA